MPAVFSDGMAFFFVWTAVFTGRPYKWKDRGVMAGKREEQMKEITECLEQGVKEIFTSEKYMAYLKTMAKFHHYSFNNTVLIMMQKPDATLVAGYNAWKEKFGRQVKRGEKGIRIIAPLPVKISGESPKFDPVTDEPVLRPDGQPEMEVVERVIPRFRPAMVFDISQTEGEPLPEIDVPELMGSVGDFKIFMEAVRMASPVPMQYSQISGETRGYYSNKNKKIVIRERMSERQTMKTAVHEVTHAMCHDCDLMKELGEQKGQMTREVEAESVAYTVCQYFGLDTSDYSFPYIAGWSNDMDMKELRSSMEFIRKTAGSLIDSISENIQAIQKEQLEKGHLGENDLILKVIFPLTDEFTYMAVENMDREELLAQLQSYHELYGRSSEMTVETFLEGQGARLIPWYDSAGLMVEKPVSFYDFEYEYDTGVVDAATFPAEEQAEMLVSRAEYQGNVFYAKDKKLIVEYAKKFDDMDAAKVLLQELAEAGRDPDIQAAQKVRSHARAEMDKFPDRTLGLSAMHWMGYHDDSMLPLTRGRALELYRAGLDIYSLQADGRAFLMPLESDFYEEKGIFGVKAEEWEDYQGIEPVLRGRGMQESFIAQYYVLHENADGREERECQYFADLDAALTFYHQIPNHLDKCLDMESTEEPPSRMPLIECRNGIETLTDIEFCSLNGKWVRGETMEASKRVGEYLKNRDTQIAYRARKGYFSIQTVSDGYDYTIYGRDFREVDGGVYDNPDISIYEAMQEILSDKGIQMGACKVMDYKKLMEKTEAAAQEDLKKGQEKVLGGKPPSAYGQTGPEKGAKISFYVAECMEFPVLGEYHEDIETLQEAMELYEKIPADRMHGVKGIGFCLEDGSIYAGKFELMSGREVLTDIINDIPHYKESPLVQKAVADMAAILSEQEPHSALEAEKGPGWNQRPAANSKAVSKEAGTNAAARQKAGERAPAAIAGRNTSGSRKQSVLNALRERQAGMKAEKPGQKAQVCRKAVKKSGMEL